MYFDACDRINRQASPNEYKNIWNHWAFVKDSTKGTMYIYLNSILWHSGDSKFNAITGNSIEKFYIGTNAALRAQYILNYKGIVDELRLWNTARSQADIQRNMNRILYGTETGLVAYYQFDHTTGTMILKDQTNNNNDGTLETINTWSTPWVTSGATLDQPTLTTISASQISGRTNATLTGSINPNNYTLTDIRFEYGTTSGQYDHNTVAVPAMVSGASLTIVKGVTGVITQSKWYYRLTGKIGKLRFYGQERTIDIIPLPILTIRGASQLNK